MGKTAGKIELYLAELKKWNRKINLVSGGDEDKLYERHFLDSTVLAQNLPAGISLLDLGSGNGFPSVPIAVLRPDIRVTAMEVKRKKAFFLEQVKRKLGLENYTVLNFAAESCPKELESRFDAVSSRAFKDPETALNKARFYGKQGATLYHYNTLLHNEIGGASSPKGRVIHSVNKIVYKLKGGEQGTILELEIVK